MRRRTSLAPMADIREPNQIPYADLADRLRSSPQRVVPFLGAGVPLSGRQPQAATGVSADEEAAERAVADKVLEASGLQDPAARALLEWAARVATRLGRAQPSGATEATDALGRLVRAETPPSAGELAQLFAERAPYDAFGALGKDIARRMPVRVHPRNYELTDLMRACFTSIGFDVPVGSLSSIAAFYERGGNRAPLVENLAQVLDGKQKPTLTHRLVARIAARHVQRHDDVAGDAASRDYLIITTNYDRLMELALEAEQAPHLVVTARRSDGKVIAVASKDVEDDVLRRELEQRKEEYPRDFAPAHERPLVVLYKMHGSIGPGPLSEDSVVISDNDYVDCLSWMARSERMIPALVGDSLRGRAFLFLGYSLNDWNVRSFFREAIKKRSSRSSFPDYAVLRDFTEFDSVYFNDNRVTILHTELGEFGRHLLARLPADYRVPA